jgi:hypothetical protein
MGAAALRTVPLASLQDENGSKPKYTHAASRAAKTPSASAPDEHDNEERHVGHQPVVEQAQSESASRSEPHGRRSGRQRFRVRAATNMHVSDQSVQRSTDSPAVIDSHSHLHTGLANESFTAETTSRSRLSTWSTSWSQSLSYRVEIRAHPCHAAAPRTLFSLIIWIMLISELRFEPASLAHGARLLVPIDLLFIAGMTFCLTVISVRVRDT